MKTKPQYLLVENVKGFEVSQAHKKLIECLQECGFNYQEFLLTPLQFGIPNCRLRYYLIARWNNSFTFVVQPEILLDLPPPTVTGICNNATGTCSNKTGTCSNETGTCSNETGTCSNKTGTCSNETGTCSNETGTCSNKTGTCSNETGTCSNKTGTCCNETGTCSNETGTCSNETDTCSNKTGTCSNETGTCSNETVTCSNETGTCSNETGTCNNETGTCSNETGTCSDKTGTCSNETGTCSNETGTCSNETGTCSNKTSTCSNDTSTCSNEVASQNPMKSQAGANNIIPSVHHFSNTTTSTTINNKSNQCRHVCSTLESTTSTTRSNKSNQCRHVCSTLESTSSNELSNYDISINQSYSCYSNNICHSQAIPFDSLAGALFKTDGLETRQDNSTAISKNSLGELKDAGRNMRYCEEDDDFINENCRSLCNFMESSTFDELKDYWLSDRELRLFLIMDIVFPALKKCTCFTKRYGHYVEGAGSVVQMSSNIEDVRAASELKSCAVELKNRSEWGEAELKIIGKLKLRYFTPLEVSRLLCFPPEFDFPLGVSTIQKYRVLGNSLNVHVVAELLKVMTQQSNI